MPISSSRMGSNKTMNSVVARWPKKPFMPDMISDLSRKQVDGKVIKSKKGRSKKGK